MRRVATSVLNADGIRAEMVFFGLAVVIGGLVGLYWKVFAVIPVAAILMLGCCIVALVNREAALTALINIIVAAFGLQSGYMIGLTRRDVVGHFISRFSLIPPRRS